MDYNNIIIFIIFCLLLALIYTCYIKFEKKYSKQDKTLKKKDIEKFFNENELKIETYNKEDSDEKYGDKFVNELIPTKKDMVENFDYLMVEIKTENENIKIGDELLSKNSNDLSNLNHLYNNDAVQKVIIDENSERYKKNQSTDLPLSNVPVNLLLSTDSKQIKLSELINNTN
jgi:regulatory protein YycI of two-component signal transduction system YycFG